MQRAGVDEEHPSFERADRSALQTGTTREVDVERRGALRLDRESQRTAPLLESRRQPFDLARRHVAGVRLLEKKQLQALALDRRGTCARGEQQRLPLELLRAR